MADGSWLDVPLADRVAVADEVYLPRGISELMA